jgi:hypothetical protein
VPPLASPATPLRPPQQLPQIRLRRLRLLFEAIERVLLPFFFAAGEPVAEGVGAAAGAVLADQGGVAALTQRLGASW